MILYAICRVVHLILTLHELGRFSQLFVVQTNNDWISYLSFDFPMVKFVVGSSKTCDSYSFKPCKPCFGFWDKYLVLQGQAIHNCLELQCWVWEDLLFLPLGLVLVCQRSALLPARNLGNHADLPYICPVYISFSVS